MGEVELLLEEKYKLLSDVLALCNNLKYTDNIEDNMQVYIDFHVNRKPIFVNLTNIDNKILEITDGTGSFTNDKIREISKEILAFDRNNKKNEEEFKNYLTGKMKNVSNGIKLNNKINPQALVEEVTGLDIRG